MTVDMAMNDRNTYKYSNGPPTLPQQLGPSNSMAGLLGPPQQHQQQVTSQGGAHAHQVHAHGSTKSVLLVDDELFKLGTQDLVNRLRKTEAKNALVKDVNQRMQLYLMEIRGLKEVNLRLQDDNQELRDLCCFLDDDRQKGRKLAREWQRFGRYTASVMRQEVSTYQGKLRELESKQQELIKDNLELKELCLYLDEERVTNRGSLCSHCGLPVVTHGQRDDGDGSSSSTNNDETPGILNYNLGLQYAAARTNSRERLLEDNLQRQRSVINEQVLNYIRGLERRIQQLEGEGKLLKPKSSVDSKPLQPPPYRKPPCPPSDQAKNLSADDFGKPEAVVHAMKVLEVHEQLDKQPSSSSETDELVDGEKALVREMCNVVWRKLEDGVDRL